jgi:hypothetical protein
VLLPETDEFLPEDEMAMVSAAAEENGNRVECYEGDHLQLVLRGYGYKLERSFSGKRVSELLEVEEEFLEDIHATDPDAE